MKSALKLFFIAILMITLSFYGCKKIIDVKIKNAGVQTIITGEINNRHGPYKVTISKSVKFNSDNIFPPVSGAFVTISGNGVTDTLSEDEPGTYLTHNLSGKPGKSYSLHVSVEGKEYTAMSVMPQPVRLDSLSFVIGRNKTVYAVANFQDPPTIPNYYQFIEYANGVEFRNGRGNSVFDDRLSNGKYISRILYDDSTDIRPGIILTVQMNCVDKPVYNYLNELLQISSGTDGFSSPAPANPESNISGGALGYFSANTVSMKTVQIQ